jgi:hypothetical protein
MDEKKPTFIATNILPFDKEWLKERTSGSTFAANKSLLVHPLDGSPEKQKLFAETFGLEVRTEANSSQPCSMCCSLWGGLDFAIEGDAFADEQSLGFALLRLTAGLCDQGYFLAFFNVSSVMNAEHPEDRVKKWLEAFAIFDIEFHRRDQNKTILCMGQKRIPQFTKKIRMGIFFTERKVRSFITPHFIDIAHSMAIDIVTDNKPVDVILYKSDSALIPMSEWLKAPVVDLPSKASVLNDRNLSYKLAKAALTGLDVHFPDWTLVLEDTAKFPVIAKPNNASAHLDLWFIPSLDLLGEFKQDQKKVDWFFQQSILHGPIVFKVEVVGEEIAIARRPSAVVTYAKQSSKLPRSGDMHPRKKGADSAIESWSKFPAPTPTLMAQVAERLKKCFGVGLLGFDVVVETETSKVFLVDFNYFPSFVDVPAREVHIFNYVRAKMNGFVT